MESVDAVAVPQQPLRGERDYASALPSCAYLYGCQIIVRSAPASASLRTDVKARPAESPLVAPRGVVPISKRRTGQNQQRRSYPHACNEFAHDTATSTGNYL